MVVVVVVDAAAAAATDNGGNDDDDDDDSGRSGLLQSYTAGPARTCSWIVQGVFEAQNARGCPWCAGPEAGVVLRRKG
jgi:hypothetical protein